MFPLLSSKEINGAIVTAFKRSKIRPFTEQQNRMKCTLHPLEYRTLLGQPSRSAEGRQHSCRPRHVGTTSQRPVTLRKFQQPGPAQVVRPFWILGKAFPRVRGVLHPSLLAMTAEDRCLPPPSLLHSEGQAGICR